MTVPCETTHRSTAVRSTEHTTSRPRRAPAA